MLSSVNTDLKTLKISWEFIFKHICITLLIELGQLSITDSHLELSLKLVNSALLNSFLVCSKNVKTFHLSHKDLGQVFWIFFFLDVGDGTRSVQPGKKKDEVLTVFEILTLD